MTRTANSFQKVSASSEHSIFRLDIRLDKIGFADLIRITLSQFEHAGMMSNPAGPHVFRRFILLYTE